MLVLILLILDLDSLLANLDEKKKWKPKYQVGDEVEAMYSEDEIWYVARIDAVDLDVERYTLTFTEYGNEQITEEDNVRPTLQSRIAMQEKSLAPAVQVGVLEKKKRRQSLLIHHPELVSRQSSTDLEPPVVLQKHRDAFLVENDDEESGAPKTAVAANSAVSLKSDAMLQMALANGVLTPEQRKALILQQAVKLRKGSSERTFIKAGGDVGDVGPAKAQSDRHLLNLRKSGSETVSRGRSLSVSDIDADTRDIISSAATSQGIFGDMEALVNANRQRATSESAIAGAKTPERKVWATNALAK